MTLYILYLYCQRYIFRVNSWRGIADSQIYAFVIISNFFYILVFYCCSNKLLQSWWLKPSIFIILQFQKSASQHRLGGAAFLSAGCPGEQILLPSPASTDCLYFVAQVPSSISKASKGTWSSPHAVIPLLLFIRERFCFGGLMC